MELKELTLLGFLRQQAGSNTGITTQPGAGTLQRLRGFSH